MDKLAAALAGYGSQLPSSGGGGAAAAGLPGWRGVRYVRVDGSHDSRERQAAVKRFKTDPSVRVALLSITAAAVGRLLPPGLAPAAALCMPP
jgi:hypothetical protein